LKTTHSRLGRLVASGASLCACALLPALACSTSSGSSSASSTDGGGATTPDGGGSTTPDGGGSTTPDGSHGDSSSTTTADGGLPAGWLHTTGSQILVSTGSSSQPWMGRGVNVDDIYFCGYDNTLWMTAPDQTLTTMISGLITSWKPNLLRISLSMDSYPTVSTWVGTDAMYKAPMTGVLNAILAHPDVYVLVTLRSDGSMIGQDTADGDAEATGLPSDATTTPDATKYPTGTDATYIALVDTFGTSGNVLFGLTNEPGGDKLASSTIAAAMTHAVGVIRAEEDRLGVPHHLVSAQGQGWTSDISFYSTTPIPFDNVVYEVHGYPPTTSSYTYANIPVILGEYGSLPSGGSAAFYADVEAKKIPNIAWDFDSYNDCSPDLVDVTQSATNLTPSSWGTIVQAYLAAHAQ
jgi:hypothetical protein